MSTVVSEKSKHLEHAHDISPEDYWFPTGGPIKPDQDSKKFLKEYENQFDHLFEKNSHE